jgi:hypothetical protein
MVLRALGDLFIILGGYPALIPIIFLLSGGCYRGVRELIVPIGSFFSDETLKGALSWRIIVLVTRYCALNVLKA